MVIHMKTTVDIPDALLEEVKVVVAHEKTTLRALIEQGLRQVIEQRRTRRPFRLRKATFKGEGLLPHADEESWERIRSLIYEERGG
jgi:hypothetical protein